MVSMTQALPENATLEHRYHTRYGLVTLMIAGQKGWDC